MERLQPFRNVAPVTPFNKALFYFRLLFDFQVNTVYRQMKKFLPELTGSILDVGAGEGPYRHLINESAAHYYGLDSRNADIFGYANSDTEMFDGKIIPYGSSSIDHIICTEVIEHLVDPQPLIAEMHRVLKPAGTGVVTVPWSARFHYIPHDYHRFTPASLALRFSVFSSVEIEPRGTDITVIASKIIVAYIRLFVPEKKRWLLVTLPAALLFAPCVAVAVIVAHLSLLMPLGSTDDPLGYTVRIRK